MDPLDTKSLPQKPSAQLLTTIGIIGAQKGASEPFCTPGKRRKHVLLRGESRVDRIKSQPSSWERLGSIMRLSQNRLLMARHFPQILTRSNRNCRECRVSKLSIGGSLCLK